jgi:predicted permease
VVLDRSVGGLLLAKLVVHPVLVGAAMWALGVDPALAAIGVLAAAVPTASRRGPACRRPNRRSKGDGEG